MTHPGCRWWLPILLVLAACGTERVNSADGPDAGEPDEVDAGPEDGGTDAGTPSVCDYQFKYDLHYPCNQDSDCQSGLCVFNISTENMPGVCSERCDSRTATGVCPQGYFCDYGGNDHSFGLFCLASMGTVLPPGDHTLPYGSPCSKNEDCEGEDVTCGLINEGYRSTTFCSPMCDRTDPEACNGCGTCQVLFTGHAPSCLPGGKKAIGERCKGRYDCDSFICADFCTQICGASQTPACPSGTTCKSINDEQSICVALRQLGGTPVGEHCAFDLECPTGSKCLYSNGDSVCTKLTAYGDACIGTAYCAAGLDCRLLDATTATCAKDCSTGCGAGSTCVAPEIDTVLKVYKSVTQSIDSPTYTQDDIVSGSNRWSELTVSLAPGTYYVLVTTKGSFANDAYEIYSGNYTLEILDNVNEPIPDIELPEVPTNNDTLVNAQPLQMIPVQLGGNLYLNTGSYTADTDVYSFTLESTTTVTFRTSLGEPNTCVPSGRAIGQSCGTKLSCTAGSCDPTFHTCTKDCTTDPDCGGGLHCVNTGRPSKACVTETQYGQVQAGGACLYSWQCAGDNICAGYGTQKACAPTCVGGGGCDTSTTECAVVSALDDSGVTIVTQACVPLGSRSATWGAACTLQSDCAAGMTCQQGRCSQSCATQTDCPNQALTPAPGSDTITCRPCANDAQCGAGLCLEGNGFEMFCGTECEDDSECPNGFVCQDSASYSGKGCAPASGSCRPPLCQQNQCAVPAAGYSELCDKDGDCSTGHCVEGICSHACGSDDDCGCSIGDLVCRDATSGDGKFCLRAVFTAEVESNDGLNTAQLLSGTQPWVVSGAFRQATGQVDLDYYRVNLAQGQVLSVKTEPLCGFASPGIKAQLQILNSSGSYITGDYPTTGYPQVPSYTAASAGDYYVVVRNGSNDNSSPVGYMLTVTAK